MKILPFHVVPHFHWDLAWAYTEEEYMKYTFEILEKIVETLELFPEYTHVLDQGYYLNRTKQEKPDIFKAIKHYVDEGRIELVQGGWVMPDLNLVSEKTLMANYRKNADFFLKNFGIKPNVFWAIDCFGHHALMPKIALNLGCNYYVLWRGVPSHYPSDFIWEGAEGSKIQALFIKYGYSLFGPHVNYARDLKRAMKLSNGFIPMGSDFAKPDEMMIQEVLDSKLAKFSLPSKYFMETKKLKLPIIKDEFLQKDCPYGPILNDCWSSRIRMKQAFRALEETGKESDLIYCSFHDLICGTAIDPAYEEVWKRLKPVNYLYEEELFNLFKGKPIPNQTQDEDLEKRISIWFEPDCGDTYWFRQYKDQPLEGWQMEFNQPKTQIEVKTIKLKERTILLINLKAFPQIRIVLKIASGQIFPKLEDRVPGGWVERSLNEWHCSNGEFRCNDWSIKEFGTPQHKVSDEGIISIVLHRSISLLSWGDAGPQTFVPEALELGKHSFKFEITRT